MTLDAQVCYRALGARDARFDGVFYVGVSSTGIYCRPICPARTPRATNCTFFVRAAEAERAGFRACFRCRPELAPGVAQPDSVSQLVQRAASQIEAGFLNEASLEDLAAQLAVSSRHLRRAFCAELGVSPVELAQTRRLSLAKRLLQDTTLPLAEVAFASGFSSVRRFNTALRERFGEPPSTLRRAHAAAPGTDTTAQLTLRLDYRPPLDWPALLGFLRGRAIVGVESVDEHEYRRSVVIDDCVGWVSVRADGARQALSARVSLSLLPKLMPLVAKLRALFDLDARPDRIAAQLRREPHLRKLVAAHPGLRVPGAFDAFETAVRAVLGQQITVRGATTLCSRLVARWGTPLALESDVARAFPTIETLASVPVDELRTIGLPAARARTLIALAQAFADGAIDFSAAADPARFIEDVQRIPGIGPWTAQYLTMRLLRWPDAFPAGDVALHKALGVSDARAAVARVEALRPFRAYAVMQLWTSLSHAQGG